MLLNKKTNVTLLGTASLRVYILSNLALYFKTYLHYVSLVLTHNPFYNTLISIVNTYLVS